MADITISLSNVHNVKKVHIDEIGDFKVRKMGAGEELDLSDKLRRLNEIIEELNDLDFTGINLAKPTKKDITELKRLTNRSEKLMEEINVIKRFELEAYAKCFDDGGDGSKTKELLDSLSDEDRSALLNAIFGKAKIVEVPEEPVAPETPVEEVAEKPKKPKKDAK